MGTFIAASRRTATHALSLIMGMAAVAWVLFIVGRYIGLVSSADSMLGSGQPEKVRIADYFILAAIVVLGLGALSAKRKLAPLRDSSQPCSSLVKPVSLLSSLTLIVSVALAATTVFSTFIGGLYVGSEEAILLARMMNLYVPIVLYTALVLALILAGFVFLPSSPMVQAHTVGTSQEPIAGDRAMPDESLSTQVPPVLVDTMSTREPRSGRRLTGLAYATPIISVAFALILGLIVYDLTRTALHVWIWVAIFAIVGAGIFTGAYFADRSRGSHGISAPVVAGARNLNFVLTVIFAIVVTSMSLGYGSSAVSELQISPSLSFSVYGASEKSENLDGEGATIDEPQISLWGYDLKRGSEVVVIADPGSEEILKVRVSSDRWVSAEQLLPETLVPAEYVFIARAEAADGVSLEISLPVIVKENGGIELPSTDSVNSQSEKSRLLPVTASWLLGDLLPAGVLLALGIGLVFGTIFVRHPEGPVDTLRHPNP